MSTAYLQRGDWVEVLGPREILATLDQQAAVAYLPFMPEMAAYCGRRFRVDRRTERVCDTINYSGSRRLADAVLLEDLRCNGAAHDGCQANCRLIWKESWLRRVDSPEPAKRAFPAADLEALLAQIAPHVRRPVGGNTDTDYRWTCQTTELLRASSGLHGLNLRSVLREYWTRNVMLTDFLRVLVKVMLWEPLRKLRLLTPSGLLRGSGESVSAEPALGLQPGEWVRVKSRTEIAATLSATGHNRGLSFDREMLPFCGRSFRVAQRVTRIIDERTGKALKIKADCVTLEKAACSGECSARRVFCTRGVTPFWRECWLERVPPVPESNAASS